MYYEKYLKYKSKYQELKKLVRRNSIPKSKIYDLNGNEVKQPQSKIIHLGINAQKSALGTTIANKATKYCEKYNSEHNALEAIQKFAHQYKIKHSTIEECKNIPDNNENECWGKFKTPNDFFIRQRIGLPTETSKNLLVSPADCYCIYLEDAKNNNIWIKGHGFTPQNLMLGYNNTNIEFNNHSLFVFRLAPHHYHRYHCPVSGRVLKISKFGREKYSVDPIIVNSKIDVYSKNVRLVLEIEIANKQIVYLAVIGATCVASVELTNKNIVDAFHKKYNTDVRLKDKEIVRKNNVINFEDLDVQIQNNEELGNFQYGGSTLVLIYPKPYNLSDIGNIIKKNSNNIPANETEIRVGDKIIESQ